MKEQRKKAFIYKQTAGGAFDSACAGSAAEFVYGNC